MKSSNTNGYFLSFIQRISASKSVRSAVIGGLLFSASGFFTAPGFASEPCETLVAGHLSSASLIPTAELSGGLQQSEDLGKILKDFQEKKYQEVVNGFEALKKSDPSTANKNLHILARSYYKLSKWQEAVESYQAFLKQLPSEQQNATDLTFTGEAGEEDWKEKVAFALNDIGHCKTNLAFQSADRLEPLKNVLKETQDLDSVKFNEAFRADLDCRKLFIQSALAFDLNQPVNWEEYGKQLKSFATKSPNHPYANWALVWNGMTLQRRGMYAEAVKEFGDLATQQAIADSKEIYPTVLDHYSVALTSLGYQEARKNEFAKSPEVRSANEERSAQSFKKSNEELLRLQKTFPDYHPVRVALNLSRNYLYLKEFAAAKGQIKNAKDSLASTATGEALENLVSYQQTLLFEANLLNESLDVDESLKAYSSLMKILGRQKSLSSFQYDLLRSSTFPVLDHYVQKENWKTLEQESANWITVFAKNSPQLDREKVEYYHAFAVSKNEKVALNQSATPMEKIAQTEGHSYQVPANFELAIRFHDAGLALRNDLLTNPDQFSSDSRTLYSQILEKQKKYTGFLVNSDRYQGEINTTGQNELEAFLTWHAQAEQFLGRSDFARKEFESVIARFPKSGRQSDWKLSLAATLTDGYSVVSLIPEEESKLIVDNLLTKATIDQLKTAKDKAIASYTLGRALFGRADNQKVVDHLKESIKHQDQWLYSLNAKMLILRCWGNSKQWETLGNVAQEFERSAKGLNIQRFQLERGVAKFNQNQVSNALTLFSSVEEELKKTSIEQNRLTVSSLMADSIFWQGICHQQLKDNPKAKAAFARLQKDYPRNNRITQIPKAFLVEGTPAGDKMKETIERKVTPASPMALSSDAETAIGNSDWATAEEKLADLVNHFPNDKDLDRFLFRLGWVQYRSGKSDRARINLQKVVAMDPPSNWNHQSKYFLAMLDLADKDYAAAERSLLALSKEANEPATRQNSLFNYGAILQAQQKWEPAAQAYHSFATSYPESGNAGLALVRVAVCYGNAGKSKEASDAVQTAAQKLKKMKEASSSSEVVIDPALAITAARISNQLESWDASETFLVAVNENSIPAALQTEFHFHKGLALFGQKKWDGAKVSLEKISSQPNATGAQALYYLGKALENDSAKSSAINQYKKLVYGTYGEKPDALIRRLTAGAKYDVARLTLDLMNAETNALLKEEYKREAIRWFAKAMVQSDDMEVRTKAKDQLDRLKK